MTIEMLSSDVRGEGCVFKGGGKELLLFELKKGLYRGGDYHSSVQHSICLQGSITVRFPTSTGLPARRLLPHDHIAIPANIPHMFYAHEDSIFAEWKEGKSDTKYYQPFRKIVRRAMEKERREEKQ